MNNYFKRLIGEQQENGSFLDPAGSEPILFTALTLSCLTNLKETQEFKNIKQKAANFLLSQKNDNWLFSKNIGINFCVLSALMECNPAIIDGAAIAKILMVLTSVEVKEGGPYYTYINKKNSGVDLGANVNIAYFLSLQKVNLPELDKLIESAIDSGNFASSLYSVPYPVIYLISKFYQGEKKQKLIDFISEKNNVGKDQLGSLMLELALTNLKHKETKTTAEDNEEVRIYNMIMQSAEQRFAALGRGLKEFAMREIKKTIKGNPDKQMTFMPYYFKKALGRKGEKISDGMVVKLGLVNIFFWTAFIIYDNFIDQEGDPKVISTANLFARDFTAFFNTIFPLDSGFNAFFRKLMDKLDAANTWEAVACRAEVNGSKIEIPKEIPDYGNYDLAYEPASAHILGPVAMLFYLGYKEDSPEVQNLISYFKHYLIAMQINDDMHDWQEDLERGQISTVVAMLLKDIKVLTPQKTEIDVKKDLPELQKIFWLKTIISAGKTAVWHTEKSRQALESMSILEDISPLERLIIIIEKVVKQALQEQKATTDFLKTYN